VLAGDSAIYSNTAWIHQIVPTQPQPGAQARPCGAQEPLCGGYSDSPLGGVPQWSGSHHDRERGWFAVPAPQGMIEGWVQVCATDLRREDLHRDPRPRGCGGPRRPNWRHGSPDSWRPMGPRRVPTHLDWNHSHGEDSNHI